MPSQIRALRPSGEYATFPRMAVILVIFGMGMLISSARSAQEEKAAKISFDLPADAAERSLKRFSARSGLEVLFVSEAAANVRTKAVKGDYTPREAIDRMLAGTKLAAVRDEKSRAMKIVSTASVNGRKDSSGSTADNDPLSKKKVRKHPSQP